MVRVSPGDGAALVHVFEADAAECEVLDARAGGGMIGAPSDKDT